METNKEAPDYFLVLDEGDGEAYKCDTARDVMDLLEEKFADDLDDLDTIDVVVMGVREVGRFDTKAHYTLERMED